MQQLNMLLYLLFRLFFRDGALFMDLSIYRLTLYGVQVNKIDYLWILLKWNFRLDKVFLNLDESLLEVYLTMRLLFRTISFKLIYLKAFGYLAIEILVDFGDEGISNLIYLLVQFGCVPPDIVF